MISRYPQHYQPVMDGVPHTILQQKPSFMKTMEEMRIGTVGRIGFIQEPGLKLRVVANPNRLTQLALEPLKHQTFALLRQISEDVTFDQEEGVRFAFDSIRSGKIVHSIDLSNATDTFPLEYQLKVGEAFGLDSEYLNHFRDVSIGQWDVFDPILNENRNISWTKGQPLGLGPSFPLFALAHHALVHEAAAAVDYDKNGPLYHGENRFEAFDKYRILGDDIIITDDDLAAKYLEKLREIGCPVSKDKTISSNKLCEFAGKIILPEGIIPTGKWREMSDRNFIDYVKFYGPQSISMLRPRQKLVVKAISELPDFLGGLGWNPHGKSIEKRVEENLHLINDDDETFHKVSNNTIPLQSLIDLGMYPTMEGLNKPPGFTAIAQTEANSQQDRPGPVEMNLTNKLSIQGIQLSLNILEDRVLDDISIASYLKRVVRESSDPRGKSTLEVWEGKLRSFQPDPSVLVDANPTTTKQPVRKVARRAVKGPKM